MVNILYVIYTYGGNGGHYRSLLTTAEVLRHKVNVLILNIGKKESPIIQSSHLPHKYVYFDKRNWGDVKKQIDDLIINNQIDIVHAYDYISYCASYDSSNNLDKFLVLTKCGGPVVRYGLICPPSENLVVFSSEDYEYFDKKQHIPNKILIPNRVIPFESDQQRIESIISDLNLSGKKVLLRIGRISESYLITINQSIRLAEVLHNNDERFVLLLVGAIDDSHTYKGLKELIREMSYVFFITNPEIVRDAKVIIDVSDCVIGTGRGFMEACSKNKIMFAPSSNEDYPIPVTDANIESIARFNFSERYQSPSPVKISELINHANSEPNSYKWFQRYFDINSAVDKYMDFYSHLRYSHNYSRLKVIIAKIVFKVSTFGFIKPFYKYLFGK